jgi:hypothetical protein
MSTILKCYFKRNHIHFQEGIKCRPKAGKSCYYSVQTFLSSRLLFKNLKIKMNNTIILPVVLYSLEAWFLTLREERRLRVFENRIFRRISGPKRYANGEWTRLHNIKMINSITKAYTLWYNDTPNPTNISANPTLWIGKRTSSQSVPPGPPSIENDYTWHRKSSAKNSNK